MATTYAEYYGAVFPAEEDVLPGEPYGPTGADLEGTLICGGGGSGSGDCGDALESTSQEILALVESLVAGGKHGEAY